MRRALCAPTSTFGRETGRSPLWRGRLKLGLEGREGELGLVKVGDEGRDGVAGRLKVGVEGREGIEGREGELELRPPELPDRPLPSAANKKTVTVTARGQQPRLHNLLEMLENMRTSLEKQKLNLPGQLHRFKLSHPSFPGYILVILFLKQLIRQCVRY